MDAGSMVGQVALHVDDDSRPRRRVEALQRLEDPVGAGLMVGARHHRLEAVLTYRIEHACRIRRHDDAPKAAFAGTGRDMDDHRPAGDIGQRLARQPRRGHARWDEDQGRS